MAKPVTYRVEVKVSYIPSTTEFKKDGEPKVMRIEHRKMFLLDPNSFMDSGDYRIVYKKATAAKEATKKQKARDAKPARATISVIPRIAQSCWTNPSGQCETWYKLAPDKLWEDEDGNVTVERPYKRTDDPAMDDAGILRWLTGRLGALRAKQALFELQTAEPQEREDSLAEAA